MQEGADHSAVPPPAWLAEEACVRKLLNWFLDRLEQPRTRAITRRLTRSTMPELFCGDGYAAYRWRLLESLASDYGVYSIHYDRTIGRHQERYENVQLRLNLQSEDLLRSWLQRPRIDPLRAAWETAVVQKKDCFADGGASLLAMPNLANGYTPEEFVAAFAAVGDWLSSALTLREISARCFRGDSKFLDGRQELLAKSFGTQAAGVEPRPLLLTAFAPPGFQSLLIVENQDSFLRLAVHPPHGHALLYSGGFRASAQRLGSASTRFAFLPGSDHEHFQQQWLSEALPVSFWGDLDFAGMGILKALRHSLPALSAWQHGYAPMLERLKDGGGHTAAQGGKAGQTDPGITGCAYADESLLPALRRYQRSLDQEVFMPA